MLLIILFVLMLAVGIGFGVYDRKKAPYTDVFEVFGFFFTTAGAIVSVVLILCVIATQTNKETDYIKQKETYTTITMSLDELEGDDGTAIKGYRDLYNDIVEHNDEVRSAKKWSDNLWTNWFNNDKIAELPLIEIESRE